MKNVNISFDPPSTEAALLAVDLFPGQMKNIGNWCGPMVEVYNVSFEDYLSAKELAKEQGFKVTILK